MKKFAELKERLLALPGIQEGRQHEALYAEFLKKCTAARDKLEIAANSIAHASPLLPSPIYNDARKTVRSAANIASGLREKLTAEPGAVADRNVEARFLRLFDNGDSAVKSCQTAWDTQLQAKTKDWEAIAVVVAKLGQEKDAKSIKQPAGRLKNAIESLRTVKTKPPQNAKDASKVQTDLQDLGDSVTKLGLDTPFGKFLQATASPEGAELTAAQSDEIAKQIKELKLGSVFRVHIS